jgi:hypothetical protein
MVPIVLNCRPRLIAITSALVLASTAVATDSVACLAGRKQALLNGHFTGPIVCSQADATFRLVGTTEGSHYVIYDYRYRYLPFEGATVMHGVQKVVVFHGTLYVGQYALSPPPFIDMAVQGSSLYLKVESSNDAGSDPRSTHAIMDFSHGLPDSVFINGETEDLYR